MRTKWADYILIPLFVSFEYLHHQWQLAFPFFTLGNGLAKYPEIIQWYDITGVLGGTTWILAINLLFFRLMDTCFRRKKINAWAIFVPLLAVLVPVTFSLLRFFTYQEGIREMQVRVLHPNMDSRTEKINATESDIISKLLHLSFLNWDDQIDLIIWPESALPKGSWIEDLGTNDGLQTINETLHQHPGVSLVTGIILHELYQSVPEKKNVKKEKLFLKKTSSNQDYYTYTGALQLGNIHQLYLRTKQRLVPFEETLPYTAISRHVPNLVPSLGGYGFTSRIVNNQLFSTPKFKYHYLICYESLFQGQARKAAYEGAQLFVIGLNESWYKSLHAASQFMYISVIRAIENRRAIARSSNDGISGFIDARGQIVSLKDTFSPGYVTAGVKLNRSHTLYAILGDWLAKFSLITSALLIIVSVVKGKDHKKKT